MVKDMKQAGLLLLGGVIVALLLFIIIGWLIGLKTGTALTVFLIFAFITTIIAFTLGKFDVKYKLGFAVIISVTTIFLAFQLPKLIPDIYSLIKLPSIAAPPVTVSTVSAFNLESVGSAVMAFPIFVWIILIVLAISLWYSKEPKRR